LSINDGAPTLSVWFSGPRRSFQVSVTSRETILFAGNLCKDGSYEASFPDPLTPPPQRQAKRPLGRYSAIRGFNVNAGGPGSLAWSFSGKNAVDSGFFVASGV